MEKNEVTVRPATISAEASIHPAWQMAATNLPASAQVLTSPTMAACRRMMSGA